MLDVQLSSMIRWHQGRRREQLLDQLGTDMWGKEAYQAMSSHKDPEDILDEKLLIYRNELVAVTRPPGRKKSANSSHPFAAGLLDLNHGALPILPPFAWPFPSLLKARQSSHF